MWDSLVDSAQGHSKVWEKQSNVHSHNKFCGVKRSSLAFSLESESKRTHFTFSFANLFVCILTLGTN